MRVGVCLLQLLLVLLLPGPGPKAAVHGDCALRQCWGGEFDG